MFIRNTFSKLAWFALVLIGFVFTSEVQARKNGFGLGVIVGEPTGPCFKVWTGPKTAIDGAVAWSLDGDNDLHMHADYLFHDYSIAKVDKGQFPLYYGIGGRIRFHDGNQDDQVGVRVPVGMAYLFQNSPLELFFEVVPIVDLTPDTELDFNGGVGIRFYIGK
ncbi:MAG: BAPKO_0422 family outer member beta-barrel protein [Candidatus Zixiibacteriota bacterium]